MGSSEIKITYETLYELLRREKSRDTLQELSSSFSIDVISYLKEKIKILNDKGKQKDLFSMSEKENTEKQINNMKNILSKLYDIREKKIINMAVNKSMTESNLIDTSNLLETEEMMYNDLIMVLSKYRKSILHNVLVANSEINITSEAIKAEKKIIDDKNHQDHKGQFVSASDYSSSKSKEYGISNTHNIENNNVDNGLDRDSISAQEKRPIETIIKGQYDQSDTEQKIRLIRFLSFIPKFYGKDGEIYGPFEEEDIANLPAEIADILIIKSRAEAIDDKEGQSNQNI
ncbi:MAG: hypothetical protein ABII01_02690 [Candidatus Woesearchaeota archaeon]